MKEPRIMAVVDPIKLVITNYPEDKIEYWKQLITRKIKIWEQERFLWQRNVYRAGRFYDRTSKKVFSIISRQ